MSKVNSESVAREWSYSGGNGVITIFEMGNSTPIAYIAPSKVSQRNAQAIVNAHNAALDARVEECAVIAAAHFDDGDNHVGEHIAAALRNLKSSSDGGK